MITLFQNLRYSFHQLLKSPSFSLTAILSLAFGIAGTVAVFSLTDAILLRPLQFTHEAQLVQVSETRPSISAIEDPVAGANYADWKNRNRVFNTMGAASNTIFAITGNGHPEQVESTEITASLLPTLGVEPLIGRNFRPEEDRPGAAPVALISANLWQTRYGSDPRITDKTIRLDGISYAIVGVMPFGFTFHESSQVWVPLALSPAQLRDHDNHFLRVYGLLRPNVTLEQARRDLLAISKQLEQEYPATNTGQITSLVPLREQLVGKVRPAILVLAVGVLTILLTTCANIAGLMVARSTTRERELAIKTALGASRFALFYENLLESVVLLFVAQLSASCWPRFWCHFSKLWFLSAWPLGHTLKSMATRLPSHCSLVCLRQLRLRLPAIASLPLTRALSCATDALLSQAKNVCSARPWSVPKLRWQPSF